MNFEISDIKIRPSYYRKAGTYLLPRSIWPDGLKTSNFPRFRSTSMSTKKIVFHCDYCSSKEVENILNYLIPLPSSRLCFSEADNVLESHCEKNYIVQLCIVLPTIKYSSTREHLHFILRTMYTN